MATIPTPWGTPSEWTVLADATIGGSSVTLTPADDFAKGSCYWETVISGTDTVDATFTLAFGSPAADGSAFAIWDNADADRIGAEGGNLGFFPDCTGWIVAVDTFNGGSEPFDDYIGIKDNGGILQSLDIADPAGSSIELRVKISGGDTIEVWHGTLTGTPDLTETVALPSEIQIGFCAGCGGDFALQTLTAFAGTVEEPTTIVDGYQRIYGPAHLATSATDLFTVPEGKLVRLRRIWANNPSGSPVDFTFSIGADAAATRLYDSYNVPAEGTLEWAYDHALVAGEKIQAYAGTSSALVLHVDAYVEPVG